MKLKKIFTFFFILSFSGWTLYQQFFTSRYSFIIENEELYVKIFNYFFLLLFFICFLFIYKINKYSLIDILIVIVFLSILLVTKQFGFLVNFMMVILLVKYVPFNSILKSFVYTTIFLFLLVYIGYLMGMFENDVNIYPFRADGKERHLLGFKFFTFLPNYFFHLFLAILILRNKYITVLEILLLFFINYILFYYTDTKAVYYLISAVCILILVQKITKVNYRTRFIGRPISFFTRYCYFILFFISVYVQCKYNVEIHWMDELNKVLAGRLELGYHGYELYGINLFGSDVEYVGFLDETENMPYFYIDSSYQQLLINYGLIISILLGIGFKKASELFINKNDIYTGIAIVSLMIHSMTDPQLISTAYNPLIYMVAYYSYKSNLLR